MKKTLLVLLAFVLAIASPALLHAADPQPNKVQTETYRTEGGNHVFTIKGKEYTVPITAEIDYATAQSAVRRVAYDVAHGIPLNTDPPPPTFNPLQEYCPNGQCPNAQPRGASSSPSKRR